MKLRPVIPTLLLALSLLSLTVCTACSWLGSNASQDAKNNVAQNTGDSADAKQQAQREYEAAQDEAKKADDAAKKAKLAWQDAQAKVASTTTKEAKDKAQQDVARLKDKSDEADRALEAANNKVKAAQQKVNGAADRSKQTASTNQSSNPDDSSGDTILLIVKILGGIFALLVLALIGYGVKVLIDSSRARTDGYFASVKKRQDEYARQTREAMAALDKSVNTRLGALQSEIKELRLTLQDDNRAILDGVRRAGASSAAYAGSSSGYVAQPARFEREEPAFPAAAEEYISRSRRGAVVVKPDFQNGMLVQDTEGTGEFMLVRDYGAPDELLYVVPRIGYFQTKQDFYNYYDRYYECARPAAGTVWIVQPAVVDRVSGGWTLREKGELEVR